jgi:5'(3')-deoxyribonucleotidase|tara:strand:- start:215 stop:793 length:579 start_codon:yes stop_codon:yes gene_type:complete
MRIGIDVDDVLADSMGPLVDFHNQKNGTNLKFEDVLSFNLSEVWNMETKEEMFNNILDFYKSHFFKKIEPFPNSKEIIFKLSKTNQLAAITGRPTVIKNETILWLGEFYPNCFTEVHFSNHFPGEDKNLSKADFCLEKGYELLIEDSKEFALECAQKGIKVFLLNKPWNKGFAPHKNIVSVDTWEEVIAKLK